MSCCGFKASNKDILIHIRKKMFKKKKRERRRFFRDEKLCVESLDFGLFFSSPSNKASHRSWRSPEITMSHCHIGFCYKSLITKRGSDDYSIQYRGLQAAWGSLIKKIQLFVYIHFPHSDYFINCPAFISSLPIPPNNQLLYPDQQTHHRSFVDSKDLLSPLKEPLFFDDWAAANFKVINLISDWLAAHQSPYQILRSDPSLFR